MDAPQQQQPDPVVGGFNRNSDSPFPESLTMGEVDYSNLPYIISLFVLILSLCKYSLCIALILYTSNYCLNYWVACGGEPRSAQVLGNQVNTRLLAFVCVVFVEVSLLCACVDVVEVMKSVCVCVCMQSANT